MIAGNIAKYNANMGDGVTGYIFQGSSQLWKQKIAFNDKVGKNYTVPTTVDVGTKLYFALSPDKNEYSDGTYFPQRIVQYNSGN